MNPPSKLQVKVKQDGEDYTTVTLDASNNWSTDVFVAAGPKGHNYTVEEVNAPVDWDAKLPDGVTLKGVPSIVFRTFVSQGPVPVAGASSVS